MSFCFAPLLPFETLDASDLITMRVVHRGKDYATVHNLVIFGELERPTSSDETDDRDATRTGKGIA